MRFIENLMSHFKRKSRVRLRRNRVGSLRFRARVWQANGVRIQGWLEGSFYTMPTSAPPPSIRSTSESMVVVSLLPWEISPKTQHGFMTRKPYSGGGHWVTENVWKSAGGAKYLYKMQRSAGEELPLEEGASSALFIPSLLVIKFTQKMHFGGRNSLKTVFANFLHRFSSAAEQNGWRKSAGEHFLGGKKQVSKGHQ